jgi:putative ABC transport system substrate-binding protein
VIDRRRFLLTSLGGVLAAPRGVGAQQVGKVYRIGFLSGTFAVASKPAVEQLRLGLRELGYVEGQNIVIEYRWADGQQSRLPELAAELVAIKPDVIVVATSPPAMAVHKLTSSIPVVMVNVGDPVSLGLATSLARPGQNFTGLTSFGPELGAKQLALLKEVVPDVKRIGVLRNPGNPLNLVWVKGLETAARTLALELQVSNINGPDDVAPASAMP